MPAFALRPRSWLPLTLACVAVALGLTGCTNNPYPAGESSEPVIYRLMADDPRSLDPSFAYTVTEARITDVINPPYYQYHYLHHNHLQLELYLGAEEAKREPFTYTETEKGKEVTKKGERWSFRIKPGLRFQDDPCFPGGKGREITAADFIYSFHRLLDPNVHSPVASFFQDKVLGLAEYSDAQIARQKQKQPADLFAPVRGLEADAKDPYRFRILLNQPFPQLRYLMAMHFTSPLPHEAVEKYGKDFSRHPVGCGPYMLTEYTTRQRIVLEANPNRMKEYYPTEGDPGDREKGFLADAGKQLPLAKRIVFSTVREGTTGWNMFLQGYLDNYGVTQDNFQQAMGRTGDVSPEMKTKGVKVSLGSEPNIRYIGFNMKDPVWGGLTDRGRKLRQAVSLSLDAQEFIDLNNFGYGEAAQFIIPPGIFGYDKNFKNPYRQTNVEKAKQLLAQAGYPDGIDPSTGKRLVLTYDHSYTTPAGRQLVGLTKRLIEQIGITLDAQAWRSNVWQDRVDDGKFQMIDYGWLADYPDPENFVFLLYGPNKRPGPNSSGYDSPEYNKLFEQMRAMDDTPERLAIIERMRDIAVEDVPWIYVTHDQDLYLTQPWLHNFKPHPVANDGAKYWNVDGAERARLQVEWNRPVWWPAIAVAVFLMLGSLPAIAVVRNRTRRRIRISGGGEAVN